MRVTQVEHLRHQLMDLTEAITTAAFKAEEIRGILDPAMSRHDAERSKKGSVPPPRIDRAMLSVEWEGRVCFLGATRMFHLFDCLARRPNRFVSHSLLLAEVWQGHVKEVVTIRSVVRHLRTRLRRSGMHRVAKAIVGRGQAYGLDLKGRL